MILRQTSRQPLARTGRLGAVRCEEAHMTEDQLAAQRPIIAGVDGSKPSRAALAWAVRQAKLTGATVEAVIAWKLPATYGLVPSLHADFPGVTVKVLTEAIAGAGNPAVIQPRVMVGHAAKVLVDASAGAELLVVGSHRHHRFPLTRRGSASPYCAQHAHCPVVVIHGAPAQAPVTPAGGKPRTQPHRPWVRWAQTTDGLDGHYAAAANGCPMQTRAGFASAPSSRQDLHPKQRQHPLGPLGGL
jgi:nucleotide-binding universal stress UspA family protein